VEICENAVSAGILSKKKSGSFPVVRCFLSSGAVQAINEITLIIAIMNIVEAIRASQLNSSKLLKVNLEAAQLVHNLDMRNARLKE